MHAFRTRAHQKQTEKSNKQYIAASRTQHQNNSIKADTANSRRRATRQAPRISSGAHASAGHAFVDVDPVQPSKPGRYSCDRQYTYGHTGRLLEACTHPGTKRLIFLQAKHGLNTSREVNEARRPHTCSKPCMGIRRIQNKTKQTHKTPPHPKHTTTSTAARRSRLARDRVRRNTSVPRVSP